MVFLVYDVVGAKELEAMFGVSRQRVQQIINRDDFPEPCVDLAMGKAWERRDVEKWARDRGRVLAGEDDPA